LVKPTLAPLALIGIRRRRWWFGLGAWLLVCLAFLPMWPEYVQVLQNARDPAGLLYSFNDLPLMAIGILAWLGGRWSPFSPRPSAL
jgi:hypothetical protein